MNGNIESEACPVCGKEVFSRANGIKALRQTCFALAFIILFLLVPLFLARESSSGYYELKGKSGITVFSENGRCCGTVLIVAVTVFFLALGKWIQKKYPTNSDEE